MRALAPIFLIVLAACSPGPASQAPPASTGSAASIGSAAALSASGAPRPLRGEAPGGSPRRGDPRWRRALLSVTGAGEPLDVRALAQAEGAAGLLEGVEDGGDLFLTACEALPFADDAELALGRLAEIALLEDPALSDAAVTAMRRIAQAPPSRGEPLDPDGVASAATAVLAIAGRASLPRERRASAVSAARAFAERGAVDPDRIPVDLDPAPAP